MKIIPKTTTLALAVLGSSVCLTKVCAFPIVELNVMDPSIVVGESFDVEVRVTGTTSFALTGFGFDVFSPSLVTYDGFDTGPLFGGPLGPTGGTITHVSDVVSPGIVDSDILLATLHFTANTVGTDDLTVYGPADLVNLNGRVYGSFGVDLSATEMLTVHSPQQPTGVPDGGVGAGWLVLPLLLIGMNSTTRRSGESAH